jgi:hypothetical protein
MMNRPLRRFVPSALLLVLGCSHPVTLTVLVSPPSGNPPSLTEVRVYDRFGLLATQRYHEALPFGVHLTAFPKVADELRVVAAGIDAGAVTSLAGSKLSTPLAASVKVMEPLARSFSDRDHDGVPDGLDNCPTVPNADQKSSIGGGGDACSELSDMTMPSGGDMAIVPDMTVVPDMTASDMMPLSPCPIGGLCDNFDAPTIDTGKWSIACPTSASECVSIDHTTFHRGGGALHVKLDTVPQGVLAAAVVKETGTFPGLDSFMHVRAFIYVPTTFTPEPGAIILAEQSMMPFAGIGLQLEAGGFSMFKGLAPATSVPAAGMVARNSWVCVEWDLHVSKTGYARLAVGGSAQSAPALDGDNTSTPALGEIALGLVTQAPATAAVNARELWIDDLVISGKNVGCQ